MPLIKNFPLMRALHICILPPVPAPELPTLGKEIHHSVTVTGTLQEMLRVSAPEGIAVCCGAPSANTG